MSILNKIASAQASRSNSFESGEVVEHHLEHTPDDGVLNEVIQGAKDIAEQGEQYSKSGNLVNSLSELVSKTTETYKENGMNEEAAELYKISVEAIMKVSGINIPAGVVVPTFESGMSYRDYSAEAEEKGKGIIRRIIDFIVKAFNGLIDAVKRFGSRLKKSVDHLRGKAGKTKDKLDKAKDAGIKAPIDKNIASHLPTSGKLSTNHLDETHQILVDFIKKWDDIFKPIMNLKLSGNDPIAQVKMALRDINQKLAGIGKPKIGWNQELDITLGTDKAFLTSGSKAAAATVGDKFATEIEISSIKWATDTAERVAKGEFLNKAVEDMLNVSVEAENKKNEFAALNLSSAAAEGGYDTSKAGSALVGATMLYYNGYTAAVATFMAGVDCLLNGLAAVGTKSQADAEAEK